MIERVEDPRELLDRSLAAAALGAAFELGLFWLLDERPRPVAEIATALNVAVGRCRLWLQLLEEAGLVEQRGEAYRPSSAARHTILNRFSRETWAFLALEARERHSAVSDLAQKLRDSRPPAGKPKETDYVAQMAASADRARRFTRMLYELHRPMAEALAARFELAKVARLLDLGGGSGVLSLALARRFPSLISVVVDIENVCSAGRQIAVQNGLDSRVTYHAADLTKEPLPDGFDYAVMCDVGLYNAALFGRIHAALVKGARFAVVDVFASDGLAPRSRLSWALARSLFDAQYEVPTAERVTALLTAAHFKPVSRQELEVPGERDPLTIIETERQGE
jgi:SAM-dependent methyltransferase